MTSSFTKIEDEDILDQDQLNNNKSLKLNFGDFKNKR